MSGVRRKAERHGGKSRALSLCGSGAGKPPAAGLVREAVPGGGSTSDSD